MVWRQALQRSKHTRAAEGHDLAEVGAHSNHKNRIQHSLEIIGKAYNL